MTYRAKKLCRTLAVFLLSVLVLSLLVFVIARLAPETRWFPITASAPKR